MSQENKIYGPACPVCRNSSEQRFCMITAFWFCVECKIDVENSEEVRKKIYSKSMMIETEWGAGMEAPRITVFAKEED